MKNKKTLTILLALILCVSLSACGSNAGTKDLEAAPAASFTTQDLQTKTYEGFSLQYPIGWTLAADTDPKTAEVNTVFFNVAAPSANGMSSNVTIAYSSESKNFTAQQILENFDPSAAMNELQTQLGSAVTLDSQKAYNYGGIQGVEYVYSCSFSNVPIKIIQVVFTADKKAYVMSAVAVNSQNQQDIESTVHSLKKN